MVSDLGILSLPCLVTSKNKICACSISEFRSIVLCILIGPQRQSSGVIAAENYICNLLGRVKLNFSIYNSAYIILHAQKKERKKSQRPVCVVFVLHHSARHFFTEKKKKKTKQKQQLILKENERRSVAAVFTCSKTKLNSWPVYLNKIIQGELLVTDSPSSK